MIQSTVLKEALKVFEQLESVEEFLLTHHEGSGVDVAEVTSKGCLLFEAPVSALVPAAESARDELRERLRRLGVEPQIGLVDAFLQLWDRWWKFGRRDGDHATWRVALSAAWRKLSTEEQKAVRDEVDRRHVELPDWLDKE